MQECLLAYADYNCHSIYKNVLKDRTVMTVVNKRRIGGLADPISYHYSVAIRKQIPHIYYKPKEIDLHMINEHPF